MIDKKYAGKHEKSSEMKTYILAIVLAIGWGVINASAPCAATVEMNEWECLFCHQYPGLVIPEGPDGFKVVTIHKERHFSSSHGTIGCVKCHTRVDKVPHPGVAAIGCTDGCHVEDRGKIEAMDRAAYLVHKDEQYSVTRLTDGSSCMVCHRFYPHSNNLKVRAILNMHTAYMICDLCHLKKEKMDGLTYDWKSPDSAEFTGGPYGRYTGHETDTHQETGGLLSRTLQLFSSKEKGAEKTRKAGYLLSRIAVFSSEGGGKKLLMNVRDVEKAHEFQDREKSMTPEGKKNELDYFHRDIAKKEFTAACNECHSSRSVLNFKKLGYDDKTAGYLKELDVKRLETEYTTFYFPKMLGR